MLRAWKSPRPTLLKSMSNKTHTDEEPEKVFLTTDYNKKYGGLRKQVESTWDLLGRSCTTRFIRDKTLVVGYRRPKNLRDLLVRARLPKLGEATSPEDGHFARTKCRNTTCRYCNRLNTSGKIQSTATQKMHNAMHNVNCHSNNLIYCITCKKCKKQYVGQTKNSLRQRFVSHFYLIGHKKNEHEVPRHFNAHDHRVIDDVEIHVLEFIKSDTQRPETKGIRLKSEYSWIQRLRTQIPLGKNTIDSDFL